MTALAYGSVCSGIEAATVAWHPLGWSPAFFAEIEKFPSRVLSYHYGSNLPGEPYSENGVPNYGDMTKFKDWPDHAIDLLVGGTPCQSFSVAGLRKGLDDPRGNLMLTYLAIARRYQPRWLVWENVPGVLSSNKGRDFAAFIRGLEECGYHAAWRVLDAQYVRVDGFERAVPQRRRRVFVVGYLGDWRRATAVLFEPEGMRGNSPPRRETRESAATRVEASAGGCGGDHIADVASSLNAAFGSKLGLEDQHIQSGAPLFIATREAAATLTRGAESAGKGGYAGRRQEDDDNLVAHTLRGDGFDASEDGSGRGTPIVPVAFDLRGREGGAQMEGPHDTANIRAASGGSSRSYVAHQWAIRRLMPIECERLQGFQDGYTAIPGAADGPRYKALGNSMAVNVMRWIGKRIQIFETELKDRLP